MTRKIKKALLAEIKAWEDTLDIIHSINPYDSFDDIIILLNIILHPHQCQLCQAVGNLNPDNPYDAVHFSDISTCMKKCPIAQNVGQGACLNTPMDDILKWYFKHLLDMYFMSARDAFEIQEYIKSKGQTINWDMIIKEGIDVIGKRVEFLYSLEENKQCKNMKS
jgi:hypothetical protein